MVVVYVVQHVHERDDGVEDVKFIGVYSSRTKAQEAVARLSCLPGFAEASDGFHVDEYRIDHDHCAEVYVTVGSTSPPAPADSSPMIDPSFTRSK